MVTTPTPSITCHWAAPALISPDSLISVISLCNISKGSRCINCQFSFVSTLLKCAKRFKTGVWRLTENWIFKCCFPLNFLGLASREKTHLLLWNCDSTNPIILEIMLGHVSTEHLSVRVPSDLCVKYVITKGTKQGRKFKLIFFFLQEKKSEQ